MNRSLLRSFLLCILLNVVCFSLSYATVIPAKKYSTVEEFLADQKVIRIAADNTPGFGNQAASAALISRLRQMGFKGQFEFIYANLTTAKIVTLFDLPQNIPDVYFDAKDGIQFIKLKEFINRHKNKLNEVDALSMIGRDDDFGCGLARKDGIDVEHGMDELDCWNEANLLDVQVHASVSPFYKETNLLRVRNDPDHKPYPQEGSENKFFVMPVSDLNQAKDYLNNDPRGQALLKQKPALATFIDGMEKQTFNTLPVYGWTVQLGVHDEEDIYGYFPGNILQIIAGARYAQLNGSANFRKPLIIPVFYNYEKEATQLLKLVHSENWGEYEKPGAEQARATIKELNLADALSVASISDPNTIQRIQELKPGKILLLWLGPLPKNVFDGLYNYTNTNVWPQIREGANSFNSLILTGRPHIHCGYGWEIGYDLVADPALKSQLENFYEGNGGFCEGMKTWQENSNIYQDLGNLIIEASDPKSSFAMYFQQLKAEALKKENDRIRYALEGVLKIINSD